MDDQSRAASTLALAVSLLCGMSLVIASVGGMWILNEIRDFQALQEQRLTTAEVGICTAQMQLIRLVSQEEPASRPSDEPEGQCLRDGS